MGVRRGTGGIAILCSVLERCSLSRLILSQVSSWVRGIEIMVRILYIFLLCYIKLLCLILFKDISEGKCFLIKSNVDIYHGL